MCGALWESSTGHFFSQLSNTAGVTAAQTHHDLHFTQNVIRFYNISGNFADLNAPGAQEEVKRVFIRFKYFIEILEVTHLPTQTS